MPQEFIVHEKKKKEEEEAFSLLKDFRATCSKTFSHKGIISLKEHFKNPAPSEWFFFFFCFKMSTRICFKFCNYF